MDGFFGAAIAELRAVPASQLSLRNCCQVIILPVSELAARYLALHSCIVSAATGCAPPTAENPMQMAQSTADLDLIVHPPM
jgi:hypothetical protein